MSEPFLQRTQEHLRQAASAALEGMSAVDMARRMADAYRAEFAKLTQIPTFHDYLKQAQTLAGRGFEGEHEK